MRVGGLEETIKVTGETPVVDVQSTRQERVLGRDVLDALPNAANRTSLAVLIPSVDFRRQDVGGAGSKQVTGNPTAHGARSEDAGTTLNGMTLASFGTGAATSTLYLNPMGLQEITINSGSNDASLNAGGVRTNYTLRDGGNQFHGVVFGAYAPGGLQSNNLTQDLINRGLAAPNKIKANYDINPAFGGPILHDKVWFFGAARYNVTQDYVAGLFWNKNTNNPNAWTYDPDPNRRVWNDQKQPDAQLRMSWQATPRQKVGFTGVQHDVSFLPDRRLRDALVGSGHAAKLPGTAPDRRRLHVASDGPAADRRQRAVLRLAKQPRAVGQPGTGDGSRAGAEHRHEVPVARFISCAGAEGLTPSAVRCRT